MKTFEEIQQLLADVESAAAMSADAKASAGTDAATATDAQNKAAASAQAADEAHAFLVSSVQLVNDALAEIVAGDSGTAPEPQPTNATRRPAPLPPRR